ncbi:pseudouridine-5'-phosphate glycosidase [Stappia taiwanensis]|uniref:Pseudouridine-5'-phosphate glycosidase n=1 Tax=Stappia taiwanensis TaxID=992267 RepID=A0A838XUE4_9HYPH|nr:pseudouridine-5'-phosphate glycosidase [Stappia taiwanensis]MBA4610480.1 pseudouridine-5'-phosphate glycosidase [Stappia taiwanensis]GGE84617.1 pseudouridine-5'-phosphate glycosidase [Stappia taiwanensis]
MSETHSAGAAPLAMTEEVRDALAEGRPVVALESTIITHGMPWPRNAETARAVEADIRAGGAIPATIAAMDGLLHIGLSDGALERLARSTEAMKCSRADLAVALTSKRIGSTTVAATMMAADAAGIRVFATGGIGGVHRGAELNFDVSADLEELGRTPVCVVAAGAKALLDLPKTLEVLETRGVPVIGFGTDVFPAFWSRDSGLAAPLRLDSAGEIASLLSMRRRLDGHGGVLVANPVPREAEIPAAEMASVIETALHQAERRGITGKAVTPFVLSLIFDLTKGRSLETNIALVRNNARLAAAIAVADTAG